jgi:hypothetical protein
MRVAPVQEVHIDVARVSIGDEKAVIAPISCVRLGKAVENTNQPLFPQFVTRPASFGRGKEG